MKYFLFLCFAFIQQFVTLKKQMRLLDFNVSIPSNWLSTGGGVITLGNEHLKVGANALTIPSGEVATCSTSSATFSIYSS